MSSLEARSQDDATALRLTHSIRAAINAYVTGWAEPVIAEAKTDLRAARAAEAGGGGKRRVDAMRVQFATLLAHETTRYSQQVSQSGDLARVVLAAGLAGVAAFALLIAFVAVRIQRRLVAPLRALAVGVAAITGGDLSARVTQRGTAEVAELEDGFNRMAESLGGQRNELEDQRAELEAQCDELEAQRDELEAQRDELEAQRDELEAALASVEERTARIQRLRRFGDQLASEDTVEQVSSVTLTGMAEAGACDIGAAYLLDPESEAFVPVAWRGLQRGDLPFNLVPGRAWRGRRCRTGGWSASHTRRRP